MGELTTTSGGALAHLNSAEAQNAFLQAGDDMDMGGGAAFGRFSGNTGEFTYGQNDEDIEHGTLVVFDMSSAFRGWTLWLDEKPEDEIKVNVLDGQPPRENQLEDHGPYDDGEGWSPLCGANIIILEDGTPIQLKLTSRSAASAFGKLLKDFGRGMMKNPGKLPVVELGADSWMPKKKSHGKKWSPTFEIVDWIKPEDIEEGGPAEEDASNYEEESEDEDQGIPVKEGAKAKSAGKAKKSKEKEPEDEDKPAKGRRRRRSL